MDNAKIKSETEEGVTTPVLCTNARRLWPPVYPPIGTILTGTYPAVPPREQWGEKEWRDYALFLEKKGKQVVTDLARFERQLSDSRRRLSRRKKPMKSVVSLGRTILTSSPRIPVKRGPKPKDMTEKVAMEALSIRAELEQPGGKRVTDKMALGEWYVRNGNRRSRADKNKNMLNKMSCLRRMAIRGGRTHNNS